MEDFFLKSIEQHRHEFYRFVLRNVWDSSIAEDVFSSAVLAAYEGRTKFTVGTNFRAWMFKILANKCFVANRERARYVQGLADPAEEFVELGDRPEYIDAIKEPERFVANCGDEVLRAFKRLSTAERSCFLLRAVEKFSYKEIAQILDIPMGTVMTHLARGRAKLRRDLLDYAIAEGFLRRPAGASDEADEDERDAAEGQVIT